MWDLGHERKTPEEIEADRILNVSSRNGNKKKSEYPILSDRQYRSRRLRESFFGDAIEELPARGVNYRRAWLASIHRAEQMIEARA